MLGNNIWFRGLVKYRDGYRVILDSVSHIQVVNMQGVGLKPIVRPNVPLKQPQIIPIPSTKIKQPQIIPMPNVEIKQPEIIIPQTIRYIPSSPISPSYIIPSSSSIPITSPIYTPASNASRESIVSVTGSPLTLSNLKARIQQAYQLDEPEEIIQPITPSQPPTLFPRQIPHFNRLEQIIQLYHSYLDTSPFGSGKTYVTCALAKKYGLQIIIVSPLAILSKWRDVASLFGIKIGGIMTYQSLRGTKTHQPNNIYLTRNGNNFSVTPAFEQIVREGLLLIFDEVHAVKNQTAQLEAAVTLCRYIAESNSRIALLSATPADKQEHAAALLRMATIARNKNMYHYDQSNKQYIPLGFNDVYNWCRKRNPSLANAIRSGKLNKKTITKKLFDFFTQIVIANIGSSMEVPEIEAEQDYKNGFYRMSETDSRALVNGIGALRFAIAKLKWLNRGELELNVDFDQSVINNILRGQEGIAAVTRALMAIESAKVSTVIRLARQQLQADPNCKVILYLNYHESLDEIMIALKDYNPLRVDGSMKIAQRDHNISLFQQNNNDYRLLIGIVRVGSVGIDLDDKFGGKLRYMFIIPDYRFIDLYQATGRIYRITTRSKATIRFVYGQAGIIENNILDAIARKTATAKQYIVTVHPAPFPGDFEEYIEP